MHTERAPLQALAAEAWISEAAAKGFNCNFTHLCTTWTVQSLDGDRVTSAYVGDQAVARSSMQSKWISSRTSRGRPVAQLCQGSTTQAQESHWCCPPCPGSEGTGTSPVLKQFGLSPTSGLQPRVAVVVSTESPGHKRATAATKRPFRSCSCE